MKVMIGFFVGFVLGMLLGSPIVVFLIRLLL